MSWIKLFVIFHGQSYTDPWHVFMHYTVIQYERYKFSALGFYQVQNWKREWCANFVRILRQTWDVAELSRTNINLKECVIHKITILQESV